MKLMGEEKNKDNLITKFLEDLRKHPNYNKMKVVDLLKKSSSKRYEFFNKLGLAEINLSEVEKEILLNENYLYKKDENNYLITLKTLIKIKYDNMDEFLDDINKNFFTVPFEKNKQTLSWDEKVIILTLLGLMAFDKSSAFKFENTENAEVFKECAEKSLKFLQKNNVVDRDNTIEQLFNNNVRGEHEVQAKMARLNDVGVKTNGIYHKDIKSGHYLNIIIDNNINKDNLYAILRLIFQIFPDKQELIELFMDIYNKRHKVLSDGGHIPISLRQQFYDYIREFTIN